MKAAGCEGAAVGEGDVGGVAEKAAGGGEACVGVTPDGGGDAWSAGAFVAEDEEKAAAGGGEPGVGLVLVSDPEAGDVVDWAFGMKAGAVVAV